MVLRLLPSHGWTAGLFGRRDRALLTLAAATPIPYRQLAALTVGQLHVAGGVATITDLHGATHVVDSQADPVLCRPCAGAVAPGPEHRRHPPRHPSTGRPAQEGQGSQRRQSPPVPHPKPIDDKTLAVPLFPPINQWGHLPLPIWALSPHSTSHLTRQV